jgi:hypothetical protein
MHLLKPIHLGLGIFGIVVFVLTGQYMAIVLQGLNGMADGPRLLYRTSHLYLMWASLANLLMGFYFVAAASKGMRLLQIGASVLLFAAPPLFLLGFFLESSAGDLDRIYCGWANYFSLAGVLLHVISSRAAVRAPS